MLLLRSIFTHLNSRYVKGLGTYRHHSTRLYIPNSYGGSAQDLFSQIVYFVQSYNAICNRASFLTLLSAVVLSSLSTTKLLVNSRASAIGVRAPTVVLMEMLDWTRNPIPAEISVLRALGSLFEYSGQS